MEIYTSVTGDDPAATCDGGGHYEIVLPRGEAINVEYRLDDFQSANDSFSGDEIGYYEENIYLWQWRHAHGKVVTTSGAPLAGVKVTSEQGWTTYTQGDGTYDLIHMEYYGPGFPLRLRFTKEGYDFANGYVIMFGEMHVYLDDVRMYPE